MSQSITDYDAFTNHKKNYPHDTILTVKFCCVPSCDTPKFTPIDPNRPKTRGRPPKHFHPLLQKEKEFKAVLHQVLPEKLAESLSPKGSQLAH